jgi:hypothetical protein
MKDKFKSKDDCTLVIPDQMFSLRIENKGEGFAITKSTIYSPSWSQLLDRAKKEAKKGNMCEIWELKYRVQP